VKSTPEQIRARFDQLVEKFSNLETGQTTAIDSPLALELVAAAAAAVTPGATRLLDIGCGAGNYTLKLLERFPGASVTLVDLSAPMLERARTRVQAATAGSVSTLQTDVRHSELPSAAFDVIVAGAVLHHLRDDAEWEAVFRKLHMSLAPGGSLWIFDLIECDTPAVRPVLWDRYGDYLAGLQNAEFRDAVFAYIEEEDSPRPLVYQLDLLRKVGFRSVEVLHKHLCFAAFGGVR
jgi:tRNA (cmo5U34)-methyltransferase